MFFVSRHYDFSHNWSLSYTAKVSGDIPVSIFALVIIVIADAGN